MRLRVLGDGRLLAPQRGGPPACPAGYERDPLDEYIFIPILVKCEYREHKKSDCTGCGGKVWMNCKFAYKAVNWKNCVDCGARPDEYYRNRLV